MHAYLLSLTPCLFGVQFTLAACRKIIACAHAETIGQQVGDAQDKDDTGAKLRPGDTGDYRECGNDAIQPAVDDVLDVFVQAVLTRIYVRLNSTMSPTLSRAANPILLFVLKPTPMMGTRLFEFVERNSPMPKKPLAIYVVMPLSDLDSERTGEWQVERWDDHPALVPRGLVVRTVSTAAGDVELHIPYPLSRDLTRLGWAYNEVEKLHPGPDDMKQVEDLPASKRLTLALAFALEYVGLAEDGRGHNARSRYLARCIRHLKHIHTEEGSEPHVDAD
jgi:hypothetical protein